MFYQFIKAYLYCGYKSSAGVFVDKKMYILSYDHGGFVLWGDVVKPRLRNIATWMEKYPKLKIGLDYESFTFDEFSEKDPELILRLHPSRFFCLGVVMFLLCISQNHICIFGRGHSRHPFKNGCKVLRVVKTEFFRNFCKRVLFFAYHFFCPVDFQ